jgi:alkylresorcinol/alkylpyrone synthase
VTVARARLQALGTAEPATSYGQDEALARFYARQPGWDPAWAEVFAASGVERRASVVDVEAVLARAPSTAERMRMFTPAARALGAQAARRALARVDPGAAADVADLVVASCTGYAGPGLDVHLAADLGLGEGTRRLAIGHMGCYAALPGLRTAAALVAASGRRTLLACVELCTLHLQPVTSRLEAVAQSLFGDGAAVALLGPDGPGPTLAGSATRTMPGTEARMGWDIGDDGFHMLLSPRVPALVERALPGLVAELLEPRGLEVGDVAHWVVHPGGPEVLERVQRRLGLPDKALARSWETLADGGNRSSATVLFVLHALLDSGDVEPGEWLALLAFGTGLTLEALLLRA